MTTGGLNAGSVDAQERIERAAQSVEPLARLGLAARGVVYAVVGVLAGYALWRLAQAALDTEDDGTDAKGVVKRIGYLARALLYGGFCLSTVRFLTGSGKAPGGVQQQQSWTARLLDEPFGQFLVIGVGLAVIATGLYSGYRGITGKYRKRLKNHEIGSTTNKAVDKVAVAGLLGRMAALALVGIFLIKSAIDFDPSQSAGLDGALKRLGQSASGDVVIVVVGVGLFAYGMYSWVEARYRRVLDG